MYLTGFADEAAAGIDGQIKATLELGWNNIESRAIDGVNIHDLDDAAFDVVYGKLQDAGVRVNCFGSAIANWAKQIDNPEDFDKDLASINRAIPRMKKLGTKLIRIMSYAVLKDRAPEDQMKDERFERLRRITDMFLQEGLQPVHENCMNYGGMGWSYTMELVNEVPGLKLVFDTGNPVFTDDRTKPAPYPKQSAWEFYSVVKRHIDYIHIKDGLWTADNEMKYTWPGEGDGNVVEILTDLVKDGYNGGISIEPHLGAVFHDDTAAKTDDERKYAMYVEYGRRMEDMLRTIKNS